MVSVTCTVPAPSTWAIPRLKALVTGLVASTVESGPVMGETVLAFETSRTFVPAPTYPMKVNFVRSVDRFNATSDFDEKLVTIWSESIASELRSTPAGVI